MAKKFDIEKRNAEARREIKILENEIFYSKQRVTCLGKSWSEAKKQHDKDRSERLYEAWKAEREDLQNMESRLRHLAIISAPKKYANQHFYSDTEPWEVIEELSDCRIVVRRMKATLKEEARKALQASFVPGGFFGHTDNDLQEWDIVPDPKGMTLTLRKHKDNRWYETGDTHTPFILSLKPVKVYDYNF